MHQYSFEKLEVWTDAKLLVKQIYKLTESFPTSEQFGITNQIRRAAVSVASNIAEGTSRKTKKEQARFSQIAYSSLMELLTQIILCFEMEMLSEEDYHAVRSAIETISYKLNGLYNSQIKS